MIGRGRCHAGRVGLWGALLLAAAPSLAGVGTARIEVVVAAPLGASSVAVHLRSSDDPALARTVAPRGTTALFTNLPPGRYQVKVEAAGVTPVETDLRLEGGQALSLETELSSTGGRSSLVVTDRYRPVLGASFDEDALRDLPSSRTPWSLLETVDGTAIVDRIDGGGLAVGEAGLVGIHGSSWTQASYRLGDLDLTDPDRSGTPLLYPVLGLLGAVDVASGQMPADIGGSGPTLRLFPRRPAAAWQGSLEGGFINGGLPSETRAHAPPIARIGYWRDVELLASGPLVKDKLGLLLSGTLLGSKRHERDEPTRLFGNVASLAAHLVYTPSPRDEARVFAFAQRVKRPYAGRARFAPPDLGETDRFQGVYSTWERRAGTGPAWSLSLGWGRGTFAPKIGSRAASRTVERLRDGPVPDLFPGRSTRGRWQLAGALDPGPRSFARGVHAVRLGFAVARATSATRPAEPRGLTAEGVDGLPARVWDFGWSGPQSHWRATDFTAWASDRMTYGNLSLAAGLRLESTSASAGGGSGEIDWLALSPRAAARWRITRGLAAFASVARYRHRLPLWLLAFGDPSAPQGLVYRWLDLNGNRAFDHGESGPLIARVGPGSPASIDPDLKTPHTNELVVGVDTRFGRVWAIRGLGIRRRERDLFASVNVGVTAADYGVAFVPDPGGDILGPEDDQLLPIYDRRPVSFGQDRYVLTSPAGENALFEGLELHVEGTVAKRLRVGLSATACRTSGAGANRGFLATENDQGLVGEFRETPNAFTYARGRLFFERGYVLKIAATWHALRDLRLGAVARYQDGQHFARLVIGDGLNQGPEAVQAIPRGRSRFTYTLTIDVRAEKGFPLGRRGRVAAVAEAFNVLNQAREVEEDVTSGPAFRTISAVQPPRAVRLGLRLDF